MGNSDLSKMTKFVSLLDVAREVAVQITVVKSGFHNFAGCRIPVFFQI